MTTLYEMPVTTLDNYQELAVRTMRQSDDARELKLNGALGIAGEAGEVVDMVKKETMHDHPTDRDKMRKELGDLLWYVAITAFAYDLDLSDVAAANVAKLRARYPEGFDPTRSRNRATGDE